MEPIKRKRITKVGSGAFSIYLPKKWVDSWAPRETDSREVDLHLVNEGLLIVPANISRSHQASAPDDWQVIARLLTSAYVRGVDSCTIEPDGGSFGNDAIASARDLLRHLDERIVATCTPTGIAFSLDPSKPITIADGRELLQTMGTKVVEMLDLAAEAVDTFHSDPDRCLHAMGLMDSMQREDVQRLLYQAMRSVARIELPMDTVSDFQFLDLLASHLERIGNHMIRMTEVLLIEYGLTREDLEYPRAHLLKQIGERPTRTGPAREMTIEYRATFAAIRALLEETLTAMSALDAAGLATAEARATELQLDAGQTVFVAIAKHWGEETDEAQARGAFAMSKIASLHSDVMHAIQSIARYASVLTAAKGP